MNPPSSSPSTSSASGRGHLGARLFWMSRLVELGIRRHRGGHLASMLAFSLAAVGISSAIAAGRTGAALAAMRPQARLLVCFRDTFPASRRDELAQSLRQLPEIAAVRSLGSADALSRLRADLGDRAGLLDGVEEGFLPATLEIALQQADTPGALALEWRLRHLEGVAAVDRLGTSRDDEARARLEGHAERARLRELGLSGALSLSALLASLASLRRAGRDSVILAGLGYTARAIALPAAALAAGTAGLGAAAGMALWLACLHLEPMTSLRVPRQGLVWARAGAISGVQSVAMLVGLGLLGGSFGWWGAVVRRRGGPSLDLRAAGDD